MDDRTWRRLQVVTFLPCSTATLSVAGSCLTLLTICRRRQKQRLAIYHRLLTGLAVMDLTSSTALALGPLPMPSEMPWAAGTTATCSAQAFAIQLGSGSFCYSAMLFVYYVLVIRCNLSDAFIQQHNLERILHAVPIIVHGGTAVAGLWLKVYNPNSQFCWIGVWPMDCQDDESSQPCLRGGPETDFFGLYFVTTPFLVWNGMILIGLLVVAGTVVVRFRASRRFAFDASADEDEKMREVVAQCLLYGIVFMNVMIWSTISTIYYLFGVSVESLERHFWMTVLAVFFFPVQGFFNFLIFIRPQYLYMRKRRGRGRWAALWEAVWRPTKLHSPNSSTRRREERKSHVVSNAVVGTLNSKPASQTVDLPPLTQEKAMSDMPEPNSDT